MELSTVRIEKPDDLNVIVGQSHFIKTVEDIHEALAGSGPHLRFGIAFCEASGVRLIRRSGNDDDLVDLATRNAQAIAAGHAFVVVLRDGFPVNVLNALTPVSAPNTASVVRLRALACTAAATPDTTTTVSLTISVVW